jgi:hypothetical protein
MKKGQQTLNKNISSKKQGSKGQSATQQGLINPSSMTTPPTFKGGRFTKG